MGLSAQIKEWALKSLPGMNNLVEDLDLQDKWVEIAQNCRFEVEPGAVDKREPVTYLNSTTLGNGAYGITGLYRFYTSGGTTQWVTIHDTSAYLVTDTGSGTAIRTSLTPGKRTNFVTYKDKLIASNGYDNPWVYDGSDNVTWELGACKAVTAATATGSLDSAANYKYAIGITVSGSTHVCGAISNTVSSGTGKAISLSNIPLGPAGTTDRQIYRTIGGGSDYYLIDTLAANALTVYTDTVADTTASAMPAINDDMPKGSILTIHRERLFMSGDPTYPNKIYYSNPYLPHFIQQTTNLDYMDISPDDGDEIMGIPIQLGAMICIKKNTIRRLQITSAVSGADPATWYAEDPISWIGTPAQWSITQTPYGIIFLGWDHWYVFDGANTQPIIDDFDVKDILDKRLSDTVGFFHKGVFMAAYTDKINANSFHDRIMLYNFKRQTLSYDLWTSSAISGANCFASQSGDDETGDLYYGDSVAAYIVKDKESGLTYRLRTKTECVAGTTTGVFVGGTENIPYMEIGSISAAQTIPDDVIIFWDNDTTTPGSGWSEITSTYDGYFIKIAAASATAAAVTHTHTIDGTLETFTPEVSNSGDQSATNGLLFGHSHTYSATSGTTNTEPRCVNFRMFKSSTCTSTEFPDGAIVMWDQASDPTGWQTIDNVGYYVKCTSTSLGIAISSSAHSHTYSGTSSSGPGDNGNGSAGSECAHATHSHTFSNTTGTESLNTWELDYAQIHMIKKVGESDTWNGLDQYVMCLIAGSGTAITNWTAVSTYNGKYLKIGSVAASTGAAASASHTHATPSGTSGTNTETWGTTYYRTQCRVSHTHAIPAGITGSTDAGAPKTASLRLYKYVLGKMKDYNAATLSAATGGTWTSPTMQVNALTLDKMFWNEDIETGDDIKFYMKTGATSATCAASTAWSTVMTDPNGSSIDSTPNVWVQYKIEFTAVDTTVTNPRVYFTDGYVVKYTYYRGATNAETSVNWVYSVGFRNFDEPNVDKIFKKINMVHEGDTGSYQVEWETENTSTSNTFTIDLTADPERWDSFFPSTAMGKNLNLTLSKNDLYDFRLKEVKGLYSPLPTIL